MKLKDAYYWKESYDQPRQHIKKQKHYFTNKGLSSQGMVFPVVMYGCESWTIKKAEHWRIDAFELWCLRRLLRVPWPARRSNQSILKEISPECSLEELILKLKLQCFGHLMRRADSLKRPWCWERLKAEEKGTAEDKMVGWHQRLPEFTQTHVHWVGDVIQPSHPLLSPSPLALNPSKHQGLFQWVNSA